MIVQPTHFRDLPLLTRDTAQYDYSMMIDGLVAGRIMLRPGAFGVSRCFWTVAELAMVQAVLASSAETESLEEPRLQFREAFDRWLTWAFAHDRQVHWFG